MEQVRGDLTGTGITQEATPRRVADGAAHMEAAMARGLVAHRHVWVAILSHLLTDQTARQLAGGDADRVVFDLDSLAGTSFGCMVCEQELSPGLIGGRCPGEPQEVGLLAEAHAALQRVAVGSGDPSRTAADALEAQGVDPAPDPTGRRGGRSAPAQPFDSTSPS